MPIYGYECRACGRDFETLVRGDETVSCPSCGSGKLERLLSRIAKPQSSDGGGEMACGMPAAAAAACGCRGGHSCG